jgi:hypothetical protein
MIPIHWQGLARRNIRAIDSDRRRRLLRSAPGSAEREVAEVETLKDGD